MGYLDSQELDDCKDKAIDEKEKRAYQFVQFVLDKTQDQLIQGSSGVNGQQQIPLDYEINLNLKTLTNYQLKLQLKAEEAITDLAQSTNKILESTD